MIPRHIHLWWHTAPPSQITSVANSWQNTHPKWDVTLWSNESELAPAFTAAAHNENCVITADRIRHRSNLVRWFLLGTFGGVWVDCDTEPVHPLDDLLVDNRPFCGRIVTAEATVIGGPARHGLFIELFDVAARAGQGLHTAPQTSGAYALSNAITHHDVRVLEPGAFFHIDALGHPMLPPREGPRYTRHHWQTSSTRATGQPSSGFHLDAPG